MQELNYHALTGLFKYSQFHAIHINPFLKPFPNMIKHMQTLGMSHPHLFSVAHNFLGFHVAEYEIVIQQTLCPCMHYFITQHKAKFTHSCPPLFYVPCSTSLLANGPRENFVLYMYCIHEIYHINLKFIILANNRVYTKCYLYEQMIDLLYLVELGIHKLSYYVLLN